mmetsp:Transcript_14220/g.28696  ORF Transcript_14220/g.28696 Transcript_14220/m.28696 type:complete len:267 (-) Transcript_14220:97-897(-)
MAAGKTPKSMLTPKVPAVSIAEKNICGLSCDAMRGGMRMSANTRLMLGPSEEELSGLADFRASTKKSRRPMTKPTKEVMIASSEKTVTDFDSNTPDFGSFLRIARGSMIALSPDVMIAGSIVPKITAFQMRNMRRGMNEPPTIACRTLSLSPSNWAHMLGMTLWYTRATNIVGIDAVTACQSAWLKYSPWIPWLPRLTRRANDARTPTTSTLFTLSICLSDPSNRPPPRTDVNSTDPTSFGSMLAGNGKPSDTNAPPWASYATSRA